MRYEVKKLNSNEEVQQAVQMRLRKQPKFFSEEIQGSINWYRLKSKALTMSINWSLNLFRKELRKRFDLVEVVEVYEVFSREKFSTSKRIFHEFKNVLFRGSYE